ncbi:MAG: hypothetical protein FGM18_02105 [Burkholderiaceae bacterium]|nr:hypothetical protein [Burkholderiaceae bacterium]
MLRRCALLISVCLPLGGCVSVSSSTFAELRRDHPKFESQDCQVAADDTRIHDELKLLRTLISPVVVALSGGLLLPAVVVANASLDTADRLDASRMEVHCGGEGKTSFDIAQGVVGNAALGLATGAAVNAVGAPLPLPAMGGGTPSK